MATAAKKATTSKKPAKPVEDDEDEGTTQTNYAGEKSNSRELMDWDAQMAADAAQSQKMEESTATGQFFSLKAGVLAWNDSPLVNNEMTCIVLDSILENVTYDGAYSEDNRSPARCFAFGRLEEEMKPHASVTARGQECNNQCAGCERNKYGTADVGRGKACSNRRRLAVIPFGSLEARTGAYKPEKNPKTIADSTMGFLKLPVMSVKNWSAYAKSLGAMGKAPYGVVTKVKVVPDTKSQFRVTFEAVAEITREQGQFVLARVKEAKAAIEQPYNLDAEEEEAPTRGRGGKPAAKKAPARGRKY